MHEKPLECHSQLAELLKYKEARNCLTRNNLENSKFTRLVSSGLCRLTSDTQHKYISTFSLMVIAGGRKTAWKPSGGKDRYYVLSAQKAVTPVIDHEVGSA